MTRFKKTLSNFGLVPSLFFITRLYHSFPVVPEVPGSFPEGIWKKLYIIIISLLHFFFRDCIVRAFQKNGLAVLLDEMGDVVLKAKP